MSSGIYAFGITALFISGAVSRLFRNKKLVICVLCGLVLGLILGLRDPYLVGVDGGRYMATYNALAGKGVSYITQFREGYPLFYFLNWLCSNLGLPYRYFTMLSSFFCVYVVSLTIYRFSRMPLLSFMLYLGLGFYTFAFSGQKEAMSMALVLLTYHAMYDGKNVKMWVFYVCAVLLHYTAIVFLPIVLIGRIKINKSFLKILITVLVVGIIAAYPFRLQIAHLVTATFAEHYVGKYEIAVSIGGTAIFAIFFTIVYIVSVGIPGKKNGSEEKNADTQFGRSMMYICIGASAIQIMASYAYAFTRLNFYYLQFFILSIPYSFQSDGFKKLFGRYRPAVVQAIELGLFVIMIWLFYQHLGGEYIQNYRFMWQ